MLFATNSSQKLHVYPLPTGQLGHVNQKAERELTDRPLKGGFMYHGGFLLFIFCNPKMFIIWSLIL